MSDSIEEMSRDLVRRLSAEVVLNAEMREKALLFAVNSSNHDTTGSVVTEADQILAFLQESPNQIDLRMRALAASRTIGMRSDCDSQANLIPHARVFLAFLNGTTFSARPAPFASAEPRIGAE